MIRNEERSTDVICRTAMEDLGGIKRFPVYMGCVEHPREKDIFSDLEWHISPHNGLLQLKKLIPLDILYSGNHHSGVVGDLWMKHHKAFASFISTYNPKTILEIGGAHGILSMLYQNSNENTSWTIIEPDPIPVDGVKANYSKGFFDEKFTLEEKIDAVVHSHVFEHIYEPRVFIEHLSNSLDNGKYLLFSVPNMKEMLANKYTNCINFEHTVLLTEPYIEFLLSQNKFRILKRQYFLKDHSIFYACERDDTVLPTNLPSNLYEENIKLYLEYMDYHKNLIDNLNEKIAKFDGRKDIYLFGAHIFSQYLIASGLDTNRIKCVLDNDVIKQGKRLYGTCFQIASPKTLFNKEEPIVILKAGVYNEEIKNDILGNINANTVFLD